MVHDPRTPPRPSSSGPVADPASPSAPARPDDEERAWAFLARCTAWEHRLAELRRRAAVDVDGAVAPPVAPGIPVRRPEAA